LETNGNLNTISTPLEKTPEEKTTESTPLDEAATAVAPVGGETNVTVCPEPEKSKVYK
jgi:hypothetical protein